MSRVNVSFLVLFALGASACSAVVSFDRDKIVSRDSGSDDDAGPAEEAGTDCDSDGSSCESTCGNGIQEPGETCDPSDTCPTGCEDGTACTEDKLAGRADQCTLACEQNEIKRCQNHDDCCPAGCNSTNDTDCTTSCGNAMVEPGETCDPPSLCPTDCNDGNACTTDLKTGSQTNCNVACSYRLIARCTWDDGCCPSGCNSTNDNDCTISCGNDVVEPGETCDPPGSCPVSCDDGNACTINVATGSAANCNAACSSQIITQCQSGDGCCPAGCNANSDRDCTKSCGNSVVEPGETCDPPGSCVTNCNDGSSCTIDTITGSAANCTAACGHQTITQCRTGDGCCAPGCNNNSDRDCTVTCNNNVIEPGETCDPRSSCAATTAACNDGNACTVDALTGSASSCTATCTHQTITQCQNGDGCCPPGCTANNDNNCSPSCGNGAVEGGETCDPQSSCPTTCNDGSACTIDGFTGSAANCNVLCTRQTISQCQNGDACCPAGCNAVNDSNCSADCGNKVVEPGETCDPPSSCPTSCNDGNACTVDTPNGNAQSCSFACGHVTIQQCTGGDNCCPNGCNANTDSDCSARCGNSILEPGETCDPAASCNTNCDDSNACTIDGSTGSTANCNFVCTHTTITACQNNDVCCPAGCNANNDNNCSVTCNNNVLEGSETCEPRSSCPTTCDDLLACTIDGSTGSVASCTAACSHQTISQCQSGDGCCPGSMCDANNDSDCRPICPNGVIEAGETCDGACPTACVDTDPCTNDLLTGSAASCNAVCSHLPSSVCSATTDTCCPSNCNLTNDVDCSLRCGDGIVTAPETCEPPAVACTTTCPDDGDVCTMEMLTGSPDACNVACVHSPISGCSIVDAGPDADAGSQPDTDAGPDV